MTIPHQLAQAIAEGSAGLLDPLANEIGLPSERRANLLQVAQWCERRLGRRTLLDQVCRATGTTGIESAGVHLRLPRLGLDTWITTNYDDLLEKTLDRAGVSFIKVVRDQDLPYTHPDAVTMIKLHGDREQRDTIVLTQRDYEGFFRRYELVRTNLRALLTQKTFLFLGYGINDPDFNQMRTEIADALQEHDRRAYAVLFEDDDWALEALRERNIELLVIAAAGPGEYNARLGEWLDGLIEQVEKEPNARLESCLRPETPVTADFTGRERELAELEAAFADGGAVGAGIPPPLLVGLCRMGGVGKTALALAKRLAPRYPDAQLYLDLRGASPTPLRTTEAMAHVIRSYHPTVRLPEDPAQLAALYRSTLHGQRALLLMDNAADRAQVKPLLCPASCALLVTSRQHLFLRGLRALNLDALPEEDAEALLLQIAPRLLPPPRGLYGGDRHSDGAGGAEGIAVTELARECAQAWLRQEEGAVAEQRHAAHYQVVARTSDQLYLQVGAALLQGLALFDLERANIETGHDWAEKNKDANRRAIELCDEYAAQCWNILPIRQHPTQRIAWLQTALKAAQKLGRQQAQGWHLGNLGLAYSDLGEARKAIEYHERALDIAPEIGDRRGEGARLGNLGRV